MITLWFSMRNYRSQISVWIKMCTVAVPCILNRPSKRKDTRWQARYASRRRMRKKMRWRLRFPLRCRLKNFLWNISIFIRSLKSKNRRLIHNGIPLSSTTWRWTLLTLRRILRQLMRKREGFSSRSASIKPWSSSNAIVLRNFKSFSTSSRKNIASLMSEHRPNGVS